MTAAGHLEQRQRFDLLGVGPQRTDRRDRVVAAVHGERRHRQRGQFRAESVPAPVQFARQRPAVGVDEGERVVLDGVEVEGVGGQLAWRDLERRVRVDEIGDRHQRCSRDDPGAIAVRGREQPEERDDGAERMSLGDERNVGVPGRRQLGELLTECGAGFEGSEVAAVAGGQPVAELVDGPEVDPGGVQGEAVTVVEAGVFTETMQEDHRRARSIGGPVPVIRTAVIGVEKWHASNPTRCASHPQDIRSCGYPEESRMRRTVSCGWSQCGK